MTIYRERVFTRGGASTGLVKGIYYILTSVVILRASSSGTGITKRDLSF